MDERGGADPGPRERDHPTFDLDRFVDAQGAPSAFDAVLGELRAGRKTGHWIWYVFPQIAGLGRSEMSAYFGVLSLAEARAYLAHPVLGARLRDCAQAVLDCGAPSAEAIFRPLDAMKLRSSITLFHRAAPDEPIFRLVLDRYYRGEPDATTDRILGGLP